MMGDKLIKLLTFFCAVFSILVVFLIFGYTLAEGLPVLAKYGVGFITGLYWRPYADPPQFGLLPTIIGSLAVSGLAILLAAPIGVLAAIYLAEYSGGGWLKGFIESATQLLVSIPSVVLGFIGLIFLVPLLARLFGGWGFGILAGGVVLAVMTLPHIVCISSDAIKAVPREYRYASLALGASKWETIRRVVYLAARPAIITGLMLGLGKAIGETAVVMMTAGMGVAGYLPVTPLDPARTLPVHLYLIAGEIANTNEGLRAAYGTALILLVLFLFVSIPSLMLRNYFVRRVYENAG